WQYQEGIINKEKKLILSESLKVVDLAEQYPISGKVNENIRQACVEHRHANMRGQGEYTPWFNRFGHPTHYLVRVARFTSSTENILHVEVENDVRKKKDGHLLYFYDIFLRNRDISCAIIGKFTQGGKIDEKRLTHRLVTDE
ncbi:7151_t:CDS:2, partial [Racocetra persica]